MMNEEENICSHVLMVRPAFFFQNTQTLVDNSFQHPTLLSSHTSTYPNSCLTEGKSDKETELKTNQLQHIFNQISQDAEEINLKATFEFDHFYLKLMQQGIEVTVVNDTILPPTPDSIFPNNWISFHKNYFILYPMSSECRRHERRNIDQAFKMLTKYGKSLHITKDKIQSLQCYDLTNFETEHKFLEGTGSLVLDRKNKIAYACLSNRTHPLLLKHFSKLSGFKIVSFSAFSNSGDRRVPIYHTNVMMSIGDNFAIICLDCIDEESEKMMVRREILATGKQLIVISERQVNSFAGNVLQLQNSEGKKYLVISTTAMQSLREDQKQSILRFNQDFIVVDIPTIERVGGGSVRCCMAEVFL